MNRIIFSLVLLGSLFSLHAHADEKSAQELLRLQAQLQAIEEMANLGEITDAQAGAASQRLLGQTEISYDELMALEGELAPATQELTALQKFAGLITFMNVIWVLGIALIIGPILYLGARFLRHVPPELYEVLGYLASVALVIWGNTLAPGVSEYVTFTGLALLCGILALTWKLHKIRAKEAAYFVVTTVILAAGAVLTDNTIAGFTAVIMLMGALGFSVAVSPLCYALGFEEESAVARATSGAFIILALFVGLRMAGTTVPYLSLFENGALFMGSFVGYLGLLIASSRWYGHTKGYLLMQIITVLAGILAIFLGSIFGIPELLKIGGTFFILYLVEKISEIPASSVEGYACVALCVGGFLWGTIWFLKSHINTFGPYIFGL